MRLPRDISPGAAARRALAADLLIATGLAALVLVLAAGVGVAAVLALPILLLGLVWIAIEALGRRVRRRRGGPVRDVRAREMTPAAEELSER